MRIAFQLQNFSLLTMEKFEHKKIHANSFLERSKQTSPQNQSSKNSPNSLRNSPTSPNTNSMPTTTSRQNLCDNSSTSPDFTHNSPPSPNFILNSPNSPQNQTTSPYCTTKPISPNYREDISDSLNIQTAGAHCPKKSNSPNLSQNSPNSPQEQTNSPYCPKKVNYLFFAQNNSQSETSGAYCPKDSNRPNFEKNSPNSPNSPKIESSAKYSFESKRRNLGSGRISPNILASPNSPTSGDELGHKIRANQSPPFEMSKSETVLSLKWNGFDEHLVKGLLDLLKSEELADVTIVCENGRSIKAHKLVLALSSPFFKKIFQENPSKHPIVILKGLKYQEVQQVLSFIYMGEIRVREAEFDDFMEAAESLRIEGLIGTSTASSEGGGSILDISPSPKDNLTSDEPHDDNYDKNRSESDRTEPEDGFSQESKNRGDDEGEKNDFGPNLPVFVEIEDEGDGGRSYRRNLNKTYSHSLPQTFFNSPTHQNIPTAQDLSQRSRSSQSAESRNLEKDVNFESSGFRSSGKESSNLLIPSSPLNSSFNYPTTSFNRTEKLWNDESGLSRFGNFVPLSRVAAASSSKFIPFHRVSPKLNKPTTSTPTPTSQHFQQSYPINPSTSFSQGWSGESDRFLSEVEGGQRRESSYSSMSSSSALRAKLSGRTHYYTHHGHPSYSQHQPYSNQLPPGDTRRPKTKAIRSSQVPQSSRYTASQVDSMVERVDNFPGPLVPCVVCQKFVKRERLRAHIHECHLLPEEKIECPICKIGLKSKGSYRVHLWRHRRSHSATNPNIKPTGFKRDSSGPKQEDGNTN